VGDLGFAEARGVVFEGKGLAGVADVEAAETVEVGEFAEALKLFVAERRMEFVIDFEECHGGKYSSGEWLVASGERRKEVGSLLLVVVGKWFRGSTFKS
jgi:hypothetical protein